MVIGQRFEFQRMGLSAVADEKRTIGGIRIPVRWENPRFIWICILCSTSTVYSEKIDSADSFLSPSPRNSISAFFQRRISSFFFPFLFFFFLSFFSLPLSPFYLREYLPLLLQVSTGLWIFCGNVSNRFMVFSCILKIHQLYSLPIGTTPIVSSLRFHNSTRQLRSKVRARLFFIAFDYLSSSFFFFSLSSSSSFPFLHLLVLSYASNY